MKLIIERLFLLYADIMETMGWILTVLIYAGTAYIGLSLISGDVMMPTPFTTIDMNNQTTSNYQQDLNYSDLIGIPLMMSPYDPALGGTNCQAPCSITASGELVSDWKDNGGIACPQSFPDFTKIEIEGIIYTCIDHGGWIQHIQKGENDPALANHYGVDEYAAKEEHIWIDVLSSASTHGTQYYYTELVYDWRIVTEISETSFTQPVQKAVQQTSSCPIQKPYEYGGLTQELHGNQALDYKAGEGISVLSPISGTVIQNEITVSDNTTLVIENDCYMVKMYHGDWTAEVGSQIIIGQPVGTESNKGYTFTNNGNTFCGTGSNCGYHTHLEVFDKELNIYIDPRERYE